MGLYFFIRMTICLALRDADVGQEKNRGEKQFMNFKNRNVILTILVLGVFLIQTTPLTSAIYIPPPPRPTTYRVDGYVKNNQNSAPISGAYVQIFRDSTIKIGEDYTDSNGYYNVYYTTTLTITQVKSVASASGFYTSSKTATLLEDRIRINHNLNPVPVPPSAPEISNVEITQGAPREVTVSWTVAWAPEADSHSVECYWGKDSNLDWRDRIYFEECSEQVTSFSCQVPVELITYSGGTFYYKVYAKNMNSGGSSSDTYGVYPTEISGTWKVIPTDDAYTVGYPLESRNDPFNTDILSVNEGEYHSIWIRFEVENPSAISRATLNLFHSMYDEMPGGHGIVKAFPSDPNWNEEELTYDTAPSVGSEQLDQNDGYISPPETAKYLEWDVTAAFSNNIEVSFTLVIPFTGSSQGAEYRSKEAADNWPFLEVEYFGNPEIEPTAEEFVNDEFRGPEINSAWSRTSTNSPSALIFENDMSLVDDGILVYRDDPPQNDNIERGHQLVQDNLDISGAFMLDVGLYRMLYGSTPEVMIGVEVLGENNFLICDMWYVQGEHWFPDELTASIVGGFHGTYLSYTDVLVQDDSRRFKLTIERDSYGEIRMNLVDDLFYTGPPILVNSGYDPDHFISKIRLSAYSYAGENHALFEIGFDHAKFDTLIDVGRPLDGTSLFVDPIIEPNFQTPPITHWDTPGYIDPVGTAVDLGGGLYSWLVTSSDLTDDGWSLFQQIEEGNPDYSDFQYKSLHNQRISFSFFAMYYSTQSYIKAAIRYNTVDDDTWKCASGEWVVLQSGSWKKASVATQFPIPESVKTIEVWMIGRSESNNIDFTGYVDRARLSIIESIDISEDDLYCRDTSCLGSAGKASFTFNLGKVFHDGEHDWVYDAASILVLQAFEGYHISYVDIEFDIADGVAYIGSDDGDTGAFQSNSAEFPTTTYTEVEAEEIQERFNFWVKWTGRFLSIAAPTGVDWVIEDLWELMGNAYLSATYMSYVLDSTTSDGDSGHIFDDYRNAPEPVTSAVIGLPLHWVVDSACSTWLSIDYTVYYGSDTGSDTLVKVTHSLSLYFHGNT